MAGRRQYTDEEIARGYVSYQANDGNLKRTARELGVPENTLRGWVRKWDSEGVPSEQLQTLTEAVGQFVGDATRVRDLALHRLAEVIPESDKVRDLATVVGILDDKITRAKGLPTSRQENLSVGIVGSPQEVRALFQGWAVQAIEASREREDDIIEVEAEQVD